MIAAWRVHGFGPHTWNLWGAGLVLGALGQTPVLGRWTYLGVYLVSGAVGFVVSRVFLTLIFFVVFTPIAAILRLTGKDVLRLKTPAGATLWTAHPSDRPSSSAILIMSTEGWRSQMEHHP